MPREFRFKPGDKVKIRPDDPGRFAGLDARVDHIEPHERDIAVLDRYIVVFDWGEKQAFYEAQLTEV